MATSKGIQFPKSSHPKKAVHTPKVAAQLEALKKGIPPSKGTSGMFSLEDQIFDDAAEKKPPAEDSMKRLVKMAALLVKAEAKVTGLEEKLKEAKNAHNQLAQKDIPDLMGEIGVEEFKLKDGSKIELKKDIACAITDENRLEALTWLRKNKFAGIIKTAVSVLFAPGNDKEAMKLSKELVKEFGKDDVEKKDVVHPMTLKAFVKERMEETNAKVPFPADLFNVFEVKKVKLTQPKVK